MSLSKRESEPSLNPIAYRDINEALERALPSRTQEVLQRIKRIGLTRAVLIAISASAITGCVVWSNTEQSTTPSLGITRSAGHR